MSLNIVCILEETPAGVFELDSNFRCICMSSVSNLFCVGQAKDEAMVFL